MNDTPTKIQDIDEDSWARLISQAYTSELAFEDCGSGGPLTACG